LPIGVLALQGDYDAHAQMIERCGAVARRVRCPRELEQVSGLIIPGGESTTIGKLIDRWGLHEPLLERARQGMPIWGTCAGLILLARRVEESDQYRIGLLDVTVRRNAFGRQVDSFETDLPIRGFAGDPVRAVFIRAPLITEVGPEAEALCETDAGVVMVRQGNLWGTSFHPELTDDCRMHQAFVDLARTDR